MEIQRLYKRFYLEHTDNDEYSNYVNEACDYWFESGYWDKDNCIVNKYIDYDNEGYTFGRVNGSIYHLSRFTVKERGTGMGSKIFEDIKQNFNNITLWSNPEAVQFYKRHGVIFNEREVVVADGEKYIFGQWSKR